MIFSCFEEVKDVMETSFYLFVLSFIVVLRSGMGVIQVPPVFLFQIMN